MPRLLRRAVFLPALTEKSSQWTMKVIWLKAPLQTCWWRFLLGNLLEWASSYISGCLCLQLKLVKQNMTTILPSMPKSAFPVGKTLHGPLCWPFSVPVWTKPFWAGLWSASSLGMSWKHMKPELFELCNITEIQALLARIQWHSQDMNKVDKDVVVWPVLWPLTCANLVSSADQHCSKGQISGWPWALVWYRNIREQLP